MTPNPKVKKLKAAVEEERLETQRRTKIADGMEPADWQERNQSGEFEMVDTKVAGVKYRRRKFSSNLDRYRGAWLADKEKGVAVNRRRGISPDQHEAGEDFAEDYMIAMSSLGAKCVDLASAGGGGGKGFHESLANAHEGVSKAFRCMTTGQAGRTGAIVVQRVCGHDETLGAVETAMGWPSGHAIVRLREGLNDMMPHYQKIRDRRRKRR